MADMCLTRLHLEGNIGTVQAVLEASGCALQMQLSQFLNRICHIFRLPLLAVQNDHTGCLWVTGT